MKKFNMTNVTRAINKAGFKLKNTVRKSWL